VLPSVKCVVSGGELLFPDIRASAEDLIIAVASKEGVIIFEVVFILEKDADCHSFINATNNLTRTGRLLTTMWGRFRTRTRPRR
jgi:hypothetical protein